MALCLASSIGLAAFGLISDPSTAFPTTLAGLALLRTLDI